MKYAYVILISLLYACSPKLVTHYTSDQYSPLESYRSIGIVENDTVLFDDSCFVGQIEAKGTSFSINCDYRTLLEKVKHEALRSGGNLIRIDEHTKPSTLGSRCHRIKASVFRVDNPRPYERMIMWHPKRKLVVEDFKGSTENRPFQAVTFSGIEYVIKTNPIKGGYSISVTTRFDCLKSYFKRSDSDSAILAHEQLHFDITEIYARRFYKALLQAELTPQDFIHQADRLLDATSTELAKKQDEYDSDVYENPNHQVRWNTWVKAALKELTAYQQKTTIHYRHSKSE